MIFIFIFYLKKFEPPTPLSYRVQQKNKKIHIKPRPKVEGSNVKLQFMIYKVLWQDNYGNKNVGTLKRANN